MINKTSNIIPLTYGVMLTIGFLIAGYKIGFNQELKRPIIVIGWVAIIMGFLTAQTTTVKIKNVGNELDQKVVRNIPLSLAMIASGTSHIGYYGTILFETAFSSIDGHSAYEKTGMLFGSHLALEASKLRIKDPYFKHNMERFIQNCVVFDALSERYYTVQDLQKSEDIWALISEKPSKIFGIKYKDGKETSFKTCAQTAKLLEAKWKSENETILSSLFNKFSSSNSLKKTELLQYLPIANSVMSEVSSNASNILKQEIMINTMNDAASDKLSKLGSEGAIFAKAMTSMYSAFINFGKMASKNLPLMKSIFEAVIYGSFFIVFLFMLLPNGYKYALSYAGILLWIQTWPMFFAIINLILETARSMHKAEEGVTILNQTSLLSTHDMLIAMSGYLAFLTPYLSYIIIKGGAQAFVHLSSTFANPAQSASMQAAAEVSSGNMSLGNLSMDNQNMHNFTAFKHNRNLSHMGGDMSVKGQDGFLTQVNAEGESTYIADKSNLRSSYNAQESVGNSIRDTISKAYNEHELNSKSLDQSKQSMHQAFVNKVADRFKHMSSEENYQKALSTNEDKNMVQAYRDIALYAKGNRLDDTTAAQHALEGRVGFSTPSFSPIQASGSASTTTSTSSNKTDSQDENLSNEFTKDYGKNISNFLSHVKNENLNMGLSDSNSLQEGINKSYQNLIQKSETHGLSQENLDSLSNAWENYKSSNYGASHDITDELKNWAVKEHHMSETEARNLLSHSQLDNPTAFNKREEIVSSYANHLLDQHGNQPLPELNKEQFENRMAKHGEGVVEAHYESGKAEILKEAKDEGLDKDVVINQGLKGTVIGEIDSNKTKIETHKSEIKTAYNHKKAEHQSHKNDSTLANATKRAASEIFSPMKKKSY